MLRVFSQSLGCPKNLVDTEHVLGAISPVEMVEDMEEAQCIFINTCAFIAPAVEESIQSIMQIIADVEDENVFIIVAGCLVGRYGVAELSRELPEVSLWLDTKTIESWSEQTVDALSKAGLIEAQNTRHSSLIVPRLLSTGPSFAWLKVGEGCRHQCSFCTIPSIRGKYRSLDRKFLVEESKALVAQGVKEIVLVAQDVTAWGSDLPEKDLRPLLDDLFNISDLERLRLMYLYPAGMTKDLLKFLSEAGNKFMPYFDMPLQHAHEAILAQMGRPFAQNPQIIVDRMRDYFPEAALRSTFIVGFPGETEEQFNTLAHFIEKNRFQQMGVFAYEQEEGTVAATMPNQVDAEIKAARRNTLMEIQSSISEDILEQYIGQRLPVLIDKPHPEWAGLYVGRTWFQAPDVDGITYISAPPEMDIQAGMIVEADIVESKEYDLVALI